MEYSKPDDLLVGNYMIHLPNEGTEMVSKDKMENNFENMKDIEEKELEEKCKQKIEDIEEDKEKQQIKLETEYNEEKVLKMERKEGWAEGKAEGKDEGRAEGLSEGIAVGRNEGKVLAFADLVSEGILTLSDVARRVGMTEDEFIVELRKNDHMCV